MTKTATKAEKRRMDIITREVGCIPCRQKFARYIPAECNHLLNGYRIGNLATVPECTWHHRGETFTGVSRAQMRETFGPSRKLHKRAYHKKFGSDSALLALTNDYVNAFEAQTIGGGKQC